jgi:DNA-binding Lrp family transcriptional regulator
MVGLSEDQVLARLQAWMAGGAIKRLGLVVRHRALGFRANGMVVWDIPDDRVAEVGRAMAEFPWVTLSYRRPRRAGWPYNLFTMIHGRDGDRVRDQAGELAQACAVGERPREILFSRRCFKQRGARYA